jgi:hypothetical protein
VSSGPVRGSRLAETGDQPRPKLRQNAVIETRITQLEVQGVFPLDPPSHCVRRLPVGEPFHETARLWPHQQRRRDPCPAPRREHRDEISILEYGTEFVP